MSESKLVLDRVFHATLDAVWAAQSDPELFAKWYGQPGQLTDVDMEFQVGGRWHGTTIFDGGEFKQIGIYTVIEPKTRIEFDFPFEDKPDAPREHMLFTFKEVGDTVEMHFEQSGSNVPPEEYNTGLRHGWMGFFDALTTLVEAPAA